MCLVADRVLVDVGDEGEMRCDAGGGGDEWCVLKRGEAKRDVQSVG